MKQETRIPTGVTCIPIVGETAKVAIRSFPLSLVSNQIAFFVVTHLLANNRTFGIPFSEAIRDELLGGFE